MIRNIKVEPLTETPVNRQQIELVERKGIGHPDSISDGLSESVSCALCAEYIKKCGVVLHHNTDETQIVAGRSCPAFGGGEVIQPIYTLLVGRATKEFEGVEIPTDAVAVSAARQYLRKHIVDMDLERDIIVDCKLGTGSSDLRDVFRKDRVPFANDTSFGVGHAPFSELENIVYNTERQLINDLKKKIPGIGTDIKVMGMRDGDEITITVGCAMVGRHIDDLDSYISIKQDINNYVHDQALKFTDRKVNTYVNTADNLENGSVFLTVTGTSAEMGDDGSVGRGNRCNGLITPNRPMSMEATSGKNPINHIGKLYNLLSTRMARQIVKEVPDVEDVYIRILSQIGQPIDQPLVASAQIIPKKGAHFASIQSEANAIIDESLANVADITKMIVKGELDTF